MKIAKRILLGIGLLIALTLIAGLIIDNEFTITREVRVRKPVAEVFGYAKSLKNQNNWSKWALIEPGMKKSFRGTDGTVGFVSAWEGEDVGKGEQEIRSIREGEQIEYEIRFEKPFRSQARTQLSTEPLSQQETRVRWSFAGSNKYPLNALNPIMRWSLGRDLQEGLNNLKGILERGTIAEAR